ncbi:hypothetical protein [Cyclobacterium plantarum]|uniref:Uncharacterized protein n=1 Tax=Cyclobacterium plantarum TaxID=2716263 RepID=A0ABX0HBY2_9BACT|nr:hypothetical protein [Cyclobacterium plantarum]NHE57941.1 hypothetical protein [Cyclobacterium plantarum]
MLVDIPWTIVDGELNIQRLIFRKDKSLYIVKEGEIQESKWEYLAAMDSLVVNVGGKKLLLNEVFADGNALILKKDGITTDFLCFVNQKEIPDLNLEGYLRKIKELEPPTKFDEISQNEYSDTDKNIIFTVLVVIVLFLVWSFLQ